MEMKILKEIAESNEGLIKTSDLSKLKIDYRGIQRLIKKGLIEKVKNGYYKLSDDEVNEEQLVSKLFNDGVLCSYSALYYYGYTKKMPFDWNIAVDKNTSKSRFKIEYPFIRPYYMEPEYLYIGISEAILDGCTMKIYDRDRLICDCLKYENKMEPLELNNTISSYIKDKEKNIVNLIEYSKIRKVTKRVQDVLGVWL